MKFEDKAQAKIAVDILKRAKATLPGKSLNSTDSPFICDNIMHAYKNLPEQNIAERLKSWISSMLGGRFSLEQWLIQTQYMSINRYSEKDVKKLQSTRHAWVTWMIQEIKRENKV
jgi:hypothetical protein